MEGLNNLLGNLPQQASDRAVLLAISSWHLYPNLLVFHDTATNVNLKDSLFPSSAVLSLGLEYKAEQGDTNIRWSLALSHLRHYGDPVAVRSNEDLSRVSMSQLWLVALGSLFRTWGLQAAEIPEAIDRLGSLNGLVTSVANERYTELDWIVSFSGAAKNYVVGNEDNRAIGLQLIKLGWRRARRLFGENHGIHAPYFGLRNPSILEALKEDDAINKGIVYLRHIVPSTGQDARKVVVSFTRQIENEVYCEWATAYTLQSQCQGGRAVENRRWIHFSNDQPLSAYYRDALEERRATIQGMGEECEIILDKFSTPHAPRPRLASERLGAVMLWRNPPSALVDTAQESFPSCLRYIQVPVQMHRNPTETHGYYISVKEDDWEDSFSRKVLTAADPVGSLHNSLQMIKEPKFATVIIGYLRSIISVRIIFKNLRIIRCSSSHY